MLVILSQEMAFQLKAHIHKFLFSFVFAISPAICLTQDVSIISLKNQIDSLLAHRAPDSVVLKKLIEIYGRYQNLNADSSLWYSNLAVELSSKINDPFKQIDALRSKAIALSNRSSYDSSDSLYQHILKLAQKYNYLKAIGSCYNGMAITAKHKGNFYQALQHNFEALKIREKIGDLHGIGNSLGNIGLIYKNLKNYDQAEKYFASSLEIFEELGLLDKKANSLQNLAHIASKKGQFEKADSLLMACIDLYQELENWVGLGHAYTELSLLKERLGDMPLAVQFIEKSLEYGKNSKNKYLEANSYLILADYHLRMGDFETSKKLAQISLDSGLKLKENQITSRSTFILYEIAEKEKSYREALNYLKQHLSFRDSTLKHDHQSLVSFLNDRYTAEINLAKQESEFARKQNRFESALLILVLFLFFSLVALAIYVLIVKKLKSANFDLDFAKQKIEKQAFELNRANQLLNKAQVKLKQINGELRDQVESKTQHLEIALEKLRYHAYLNSHSVRRPLANIMGIVSLFDKENPSNPDNLLYLKLIEDCANELDRVIHKINDTVSLD
jgi:tetratricopeptide (TPR) repeat protein